MRRDSLFYQVFQQFPYLLFDLIETSPPQANRYRFESVSVKEPTFTIDGVFLPPESEPPGTSYFCEVQFQKDERLYERLFAESALYFYRNRSRFANWQFVVIYPSRSLEQSVTLPYHPWLNSSQMHRIYLEELGTIEALPIGIALMVLTIVDEAEAPQMARILRGRLEYGDSSAQEASDAELTEEMRRGMIDLLITIMVYKFTTFNRQEIEAMLDIRLQETRVYQEAKEEGRQEGRQEGQQEGRQEGRQQEALRLTLKLLTLRLNQELPEALRDRISSLAIVQLEALAAALLNFTTLTDLTHWLETEVRSE